MTKQTVSNMKLIILEMEKQLVSMIDFKSLKALSHSYETLLDQLNVKNEDFKGHKMTEEMRSHLHSIEIIKNKLESTSIPKLLKVGDYLGVNHLTTTTTRLHSTINSLNRLLYLLCKEYNNETLIVSDYKFKSREFSYKLIEQNNEKVLEEIPYRYGVKIITDTNTYDAMELSEMNRGKRYKFEVAYVDEALTSDRMKLVLEEIRGVKVINKFNSKPIY